MGRPATLKVDIITDDRGAGRGISSTDSKLGKLGRVAGKAGKLMAAGLAVGGAAAIAAGAKVAQSASRQEQAFGALDSIYGKNSERVKKWALAASDSVGLAASEYAELSSLVGAQLQGMGYAVDKSAQKSRELVTTGADLAATFGGSVSDAVSAVSSLLKGERDPIERYGVSIKQADVNARLAALGLEDLTGKAAKQAEAQAVLSLLNEQTAKTTGQFKRESASLAGQQERLKAKFENVKATVGAKLTPVLAALFGWISDKLLPWSTKLGAQLSTKLGPAFRAVGQFVTGRLVPALSSLYSWFMERIYPSLQSAIKPVLDGIRAAFSRVSRAVGDNSGQLSKLVRWAGYVIEAFNPVRVLVGKLLGAAFRVAGGVIEGIIGTIGGLVTIAERAADAIGWVIDKVRSLSSLSPGKLLDKLGGLFSAAPLARMVSPLSSGISGVTAPTGGLALSSLDLTTSAGAGAGGLGLAGATGAGVSYVDARDLSVTLKVDGALDPVAVGRQLEKLLEQHRRRLGRAGRPVLA